jgi:tetratricopeptide (TPR) repeat protein
MLCLAGERGALAGLVQRLAAIDADELERAMQAVLGLPDVARCRDAQALLAEVAPPTDVATTQAVLGVQSQFAAAISEWTLGHLDDAERHATEALTRAQATGHAPLVVLALYHLGKLQQGRDARAEAEATLTRAAWIAAELGDDERLGVAAAALARVIALPGDRGSEVRTWIRLARTMTQRTAPHGRAHFEALYESGSVEYRAGRLAEAGDWYAQALGHAEQHLGPRSISAFIARGMLALVLGERGEYDASLAQFERLAEVQAEMFGPSHPVIATHHNNRGVILRQAGRADEALAGFSQALEIWRDAYGPDHPDVGMAHGNIASALLTRARAGDFEAAEPHLRRAIETRERSLGPDDLDLAVDVSNLGDLHLFRLELDEAEREYMRAVAILERTGNGEHPRIVLPLTGLGAAAWLRGDGAAQRRHYERVLKIQESSFGPDYPEIAGTLRGLAEAALQDGALELAEHYLVRASALDAKVGEDEARARESLALRGQLALRRGDPVVASELLARALRGNEDRELDPYVADRSSTLARALVAAGRVEEARPLIERIAAYYRPGGPALTWRVDALEALLPGPRGREYTRADVRAE